MVETWDLLWSFRPGNHAGVPLSQGDTLSYVVRGLSGLGSFGLAGQDLSCFVPWDRWVIEPLYYWAGGFVDAEHFQGVFADGGEAVE